MDELIHHCLRELSFDGDFGCNISRLRDFIIDFYANGNAQHPQNTDEAFCSFVLSLIVQQPKVLIGTRPEGVTSEVWVAPQIKKLRKAKAEGEEISATNTLRLDLIPDAKTRPLNELINSYGENLRIALDPDAIYAALSGTHIRFPKLSAMVYTALQVITRGRDDGVTVIDLGKATAYDQKTCFYLVKILTDLDLIVKVRKGGVGSNFCIHKYFFERSQTWNSIREEEGRAEENGASTQAPDDVVEDEEEDATQSGLDFTPIDARHLSSLPLVRARVLKLLRASKNNIHASSNMVKRIGFLNPTKTDRRFFQARIREMEAQNLIEKVVVPTKHKKSGNPHAVSCFRLVTKGENQDDMQEGSISSEEAQIQKDLIRNVEDDVDLEEADNLSGIKTNVTVHKQISDLIESSGTTGLTLNELSAALLQFDKRTIELYLARAEKVPPPPHLRDLALVAVMETSGRERRNRYFTLAAYRELLTKENLHDSSAPYADLDLDEVGGFMPVDYSLFYSDVVALRQYQDSLKRKTKWKSKPRKNPPKNPVLPDGSIKQGRPRKQPYDEEGNILTGRQPKKRKREGEAGDDVQPPKKRGRPKKGKADDIEPLPPKAKRQRLNNKSSEANEGEDEMQKPKKRSRVSKSKDRSDGRQDTTEVQQVDALPSGSDRRVNDGANEDVTGITESSIVFSDRVAPGMPSIGSTEDALNPATDLVDHNDIAARDVIDSVLNLSNTPPAASDTQTAATVPTMKEMGSLVPIDPELLKQDEVILSLRSTTPLSAIQQQESSKRVQKSKPKEVTHARVNVSHLRRENEFLRVIDEAGGIMNILSKEFFDAHGELLQTLAAAGETTSAAVGSRTDKRTVQTVFGNLEMKGKIKLLKTSVVSHTGVSRSVTLAHVPDLEQRRINEYLAELNRNAALPPTFLVKGKSLEKGVEFTTGAPQDKVLAPLQLLRSENPEGAEDTKERWVRNSARTEQLFTCEDAVIRDVLLTDRYILGQYYGFILAKMVRARTMHLASLEAFDQRSPSPLVISHEHRILDISFFSSSINLGLYCSLVSPTQHDEAVAKFLRTDAGRNTLLSELPLQLYESLQIGRARAKSRILDTMVVLWSLNLVTPLQTSTSATPFITCSMKGNYPASFDIASSDGWSAGTVLAAPTYWHFNAQGPIYHYASSASDPPFWKDLSIRSANDATDYWNTLRTACLTENLSLEDQQTCSATNSSSSDSLKGSLCRKASWNPEYNLSWHQKQYLNRSGDKNTGHTPLLDEDGGADKIKHISWIISAPESVIKDYFQEFSDRVQREMAKAKERNEAKKKNDKDATGRAALAKKRAEARLERERQWENLLQRLHPDPIEGALAVRLRRIRSKFLETSLDPDAENEKWESEIRNVIQEVATAAQKVLKAKVKSQSSLPKQPTATIPIRPVAIISQPLGSIVLPSLAVNPPEKDIKTLIAAQGAPLPAEVRKKKPKKAGDPTPPKPQIATRRAKFGWNYDYEEILRDGSAVIRSRCRSSPRVDWTAFEQLFPAIPRNAVRQRLASLREEPGTEAYLNRLEERWHDLWLRYRGTPYLPDTDINSTSNFDAVNHVEFLRKYVDKNALRVGLSQPQERSSFIIPGTVNSLHDNFDVVEVQQTLPTWDFMWNLPSDDARERRSLEKAITLGYDGVPRDAEASNHDRDLLAESALKMVFGAPNSTYEPALGSLVLHSVGEASVSNAARNLLGRGVLSKRMRDPTKKGPGRQLKISDTNANAIGGSLPQDMFQDAAAFQENILRDDNWIEWSLLSGDGETAALAHFASDGAVEFVVDTSHAQSRRPDIDWVSKKASDDDFETAIQVRFDSLKLNEGEAGPSEHREVSTPPEVRSHIIDDSLEHGLAHDGSPAACSLEIEEVIVDCDSCLVESWRRLESSLEPEESVVCENILTEVKAAEGQGLSKAELLDVINVPHAKIWTAVQRLTEQDVPLVYWVGYSQLALISSAWVKNWSVQVSEKPVSRLFPRRWLDIRGSIVTVAWEAALRAVIGVVLFRPGITQTELRWRLRSIYDRQEVNDLLMHLSDEGMLKRIRKIDDEIWDGLPLDNEEEGNVYWMLGDRKKWYQIQL